MTVPDPPDVKRPTIAPRLGLWDAVSIIVGIVVGTAIFKSPMMVFQNTTGPWQAMGVWLAGGALSLCGALCYAELATTYPRDGGDYEYLSRAYGRWLGFLFGWGQLAVVLSASIGAMAYALTDYAVAIWPAAARWTAWPAVAAIVSLAVLNALGVVAGKATQNVLSAVKVLGLVGVVLAGLWAGSSALAASPPTPPGSFAPSLGLAMVFVLYAYGGWSDAAFVAAEVRDQRRNLPRALWIGVLGITAIYLAVNAAYLGVLGFDAARESAAPAADVLEHAFGPWGRTAVSLLVMISALGAINGMILAGSRVYAVVGADYPGIAWLGAWNRRAAPLVAIGTQALAAGLLVLAVGTTAGRSLLDAALGSVGLAGLPWAEYFGGFETLLAGSAPVFWTFFLLTGLAVFVLRWKNPTADRPFTIPFYPLPPLVFCATCLYMVWSSLAYARWLVLLGLVPLAVGVPLLWLARRGAAPLE